MTAATAFAGGFADPAREGAAVFRAALDAMARPGRVRETTGAAPPEGLSPGAGAVLLCLADASTPVWLPPRLALGEVADWLRFHANAPAGATREGAAFAVGRWDELLPLEDWPAGDAAYPDRSTTLIVEVAALDGGPELTLSGPGIDGRAVLAPALPAGTSRVLEANAARFPLGVDLFLTSGTRLVALPRTTRIGG